MRRSPLAAVLLVSLVVAGCGSSSEDNEGMPSASNEGELLARVSAAIAAQQDADGSLDDVVYADFVRAREQVGLGADADVYEVETGKSSRASLLASLSSRALAYSGRPDATPLEEAIDGAAIEASAGTPVVGPPSALVLESSQPFEEISVALLERGYVRDDDLLVTDRSISTVVYPVVTDAGGGVVVLAGSKRAARAALRGRNAKLTQAAQLIKDVRGVARAASTRPNRCILARAAGQDLAPQKGEYLVVIDDTADAAKLTVAGRTLPGGQSDLIFGEAEAELDRVGAEFRSEDPLNVAFHDFMDDDSLAARTSEFELPYAC